MQAYIFLNLKILQPKKKKKYPVNGGWQPFTRASLTSAQDN